MTLPLIDISDLTVRLGTTDIDTARAAALIDDTSAAVRGYTGRSFLDEDDALDVPADVVAVVCQIVGRALGTSAAAGAIQQESLGSYSYSIGSAAAAGPLGMLPSERETLDRHRVRVRTMQLGSWL